jgi:hypothetical protein
MCLKTPDRVVHLINKEADGPFCPLMSFASELKACKPGAAHEINHIHGSEG